ncbi:MAG: hypothetical protein ABI475_05410 [Methylophilaceae bacterium]
MNRKIAAIIALQILLIIVLFWMLVFYGKDEYEAYTHEQGDEIESPSRVGIDAGLTIVTLSPQAQAQSGITTSKLKASTHQNTLSTFGTVLSIDALIDLRTRYLTAKADASVARASLTNSQQEYQRLLQLNRDNRNISDRAVMAAEAAWKADEARVLAAETTANNVRDNIRQSWGEALTNQATQQPAGASLQRLLQYREVLLQIALPFDAPSPKPGSMLAVTPTGSRDKTIQAEFVSPSPQTDSTIQGKTYYYRAAADELRAGMRVTVHMADSAVNVTGVIVPDSAVVWYGGKAWVYRKEDANRFVRLPVNTDMEANSGWFNAGNVKPGQALVTSGAQLLLSEEFKYQIKNENAD